ncbi:MAG TPA: cation:proton antiporter [Terriglobia bacterium]|nr:cation:proton antiporter [Terriglobia bacterium]
MTTEILDFLRTHAASLSPLARFAVGMAVVLVVPPVSRRLKLPPVVGLLFAGILIGPYVLDIFGKERPVADFMADLGKLLLMFYAGLEVDLALFRQSQRKVTIFGLLTTTLPLLFGTAVGLWFGYAAIPAIVLGSLLASHTLLGMPIVKELGASRLEPVTVTAGATAMSDTLSLVVFAVCLSSYQRGFSISVLATQLVEIVAFVALVLFGLSRVARYALTKVEDQEDAFFILMFGFMAVAAVLAGLVQLPGIVGAFLIGLALNEASQNKPAKEKLRFFANTLFIPAFLLVTGFLINPALFIRSLIDHFALAASIVLALVVGKFLAAQIAGRAFNYSPAARMTVWSLTLPQVAATLAATLVGFNTFDPEGGRLIDERVLNAVFVLMLSTSILGPVFTQRYTPLMLRSWRGQDSQNTNAA